MNCSWEKLVISMDCRESLGLLHKNLISYSPIEIGLFMQFVLLHGTTAIWMHWGSLHTLHVHIYIIIFLTYMASCLFLYFFVSFLHEFITLPVCQIHWICPCFSKLRTVPQQIQKHTSSLCKHTHMHNGNHQIWQFYRESKKNIPKGG